MDVLDYDLSIYLSRSIFIYVFSHLSVYLLFLSIDVYISLKNKYTMNQFLKIKLSSKETIILLLLGEDNAMKMNIVVYWSPTRPGCQNRKYTCVNNRCIRSSNIRILLYFDLRPGQTCHFKVMHRKEVTHSNGSYERKSRRRALADEMGQGKKSHGTLIDWYTGREWPLNCMTIKHAIPKIEWAIEWTLNYYITRSRQDS